MSSPCRNHFDPDQQLLMAQRRDGRSPGKGQIAARFHIPYRVVRQHNLPVSLVGVRLHDILLPLASGLRHRNDVIERRIALLLESNTNICPGAVAPIGAETNSSRLPLGTSTPTAQALKA